MGFFNSTASIGGTANIEDLLEEDLNIYEGMSIMEANYAAIAENEMNWNAIMEAAAATEMSYFAENDEEYVYTEASGFLASVSAFFKKIWEKIKSIFKKFMVIIGSLWTKDKDFVKKYGETIRRNMKNIPSDTEIKGYNFAIEPNDTIPTYLKKANDRACAFSGKINTDWKTFGSSKEDKRVVAIDAAIIGLLGVNLNKTADDDDFDMTDANETLRGSIINKSSMTSSEFSKEVAEMLRGGESSPIDLKLNSTTVSKAMSDLEGAKDARKKASNLYKQGEKAFKKIINDMEKLESSGYKTKPEDGEADDQAKELRTLNRAINLLKSMSNDLTTMNSLYLTAVKDKYNQDKRMCVKVVTFREAKNEGAYVEHFAEGSAFAGLNLI